MNFYENLLQFTYLTQVEGIYPFIQIHDSDKLRLLQPVTERDIWATINRMGNNKSPSLDGLTAKFYQTHWHEVGPIVCNLVCDFFSTGHMRHHIHHALLIFIPKRRNPTQVAPYRPISLCNMIYKIISTILVERLRPILQYIVFPYQSTFLKGRHI